jgi:hypothetical protein
MHQREVYQRFFQASAAALQQLAADPHFLGGRIGLLGVLQTWTRDLRYHPHIHYLVPAVALAADGRWLRPAKASFLVHVRPLGELVRAKLRASLRQLPAAASVPAAVWRERWVVDCRPVGSGTSALKYLAPYIFRVALSNNRIVRVADERVTFRYIDGKTHATKTCTLPALTFLDRFLQHVLPRGFVKVRRFGLFRPCERVLLAQLRAQLALEAQAACQPEEEADDQLARVTLRPQPRSAASCPVCGQLMQARALAPAGGRGPPGARGE